MPAPEPRPLRCPDCGARMQVGVLPVSSGLNWQPWSPTATMSMAEGIPGTSSVHRANRLEAHRCRKCEIVLFRYGRKFTDPLAPDDELPPPKERDD